MLFTSKRPTASDRKIAALEKRVLDLQSEVESRDRTIRILQAEVETMALVVSRDRERIRSEIASFVKVTAGEGR